MQQIIDEMEQSGCDISIAIATKEPLTFDNISDAEIMREDALDRFPCTEEDIEDAKYFYDMNVTISWDGSGVDVAGLVLADKIIALCNKRHTNVVYAYLKNYAD